MPRLGCGLTIAMKTIVIQVKGQNETVEDCWDMHCFSIWKAQRLLVYPFLLDPWRPRLFGTTDAWRWLDLFPINSENCLVVYLSLRKIWKSVGIMKFPIYGKKCSKPSTVQHGKFRFELYLMASLTKHDKPIGGSPHLATSFWKKTANSSPRSRSSVFSHIFPWITGLLPLDNQGTTGFWPSFIHLRAIWAMGWSSKPPRRTIAPMAPHLTGPRRALRSRRRWRSGEVLFKIKEILLHYP